MGDIIPRFSGSLMTDDVVGLVNCNLGYPPPFRKSSRDCDDRVSDSISCVNYAIFYCESRVLFWMKQYLAKQCIVIISIANHHQEVGSFEVDLQRGWR